MNIITWILTPAPQLGHTQGINRILRFAISATSKEKCLYRGVTKFTTIHEDYWKTVN